MLSYPPEVLDAMIASQDVFVWEAPLFERHERSKRWYLFMSLIALALTGYAIWTANFPFAFIILLAAIIMVIAGNKQPDQVLIQIGENGVVWNGTFHPFQEIQTFGIVYQPPGVKVLYLEKNNLLKPRLRIPLGEQNPLEIREHLKQYVREDLDLRDEHFSDIVGRLLRI